MEVMEDGNLIDKVNILIQRDMEYYNSKQAILQETICPGVIGGKLDFPRSASFASMKLVMWLEEEFVAAHKTPSGFLPKDDENTNKHSEDSDEGIIKDSYPSKFVSLTAKTADQFLVHLNVLTQEALDHADLSVLTGTIGAAALLKNSLWFYVKIMKENRDIDLGDLQNSYKKYQEMCEALAERLLDLHCRLVSLYILQDAECLHWESDRPFFESERGSYVIQMWWLYMKGTKEDLWNTVPPKMAQRVFAGMLNESLTILTVRYTQSVPSETRSRLIVVDISNLLVCVAELLPAICDNAKELIGFSYSNSSKILRDIHTKCQELLTCLLLRGSPIDVLYKVFRKGLDNVEMFKSRALGVAPWIVFALPNVFRADSKQIVKTSDLNPQIMVALELIVLLAQPQPNWALLLQVLCMDKFKILRLILESSPKNIDVKMQKPQAKNSKCEAFLCYGDGTCQSDNASATVLEVAHYYDLTLASTEILLFVGRSSDLVEILLPVVTEKVDWAHCLERRHVWNQIREPWYESILNFTAPIIPIAADTVIDAIQTGATMYQAMSLVVACFSHFWDYIHPALYKTSNMLQEVLPTDTVPLGNSALLQILVCALYSKLLRTSQTVKKRFRIDETAGGRQSQSSGSTAESCVTSPEAVALAVAESLCSIDEDNKHTDQIEEFLEQVKENYKEADSEQCLSKRLEVNQHFAEVVVSDILETTSGKKNLKVLYWFIKCNAEYFYQQLGISTEEDVAKPDRAAIKSLSLLYTMFNIGYRPFDELLSGKWQPNWLELLQNSMGLNAERVWKQLSLRWEFRNFSSSTLSAQTANMINRIINVLKQ